MNLLISFPVDATEQSMANALSALADIVRDNKYDDTEELMDGSYPIKTSTGETLAFYTFQEDE